MSVQPAIRHFWDDMGVSLRRCSQRCAYRNICRYVGVFGGVQVAEGSSCVVVYTLPETNMETQKGPFKDYSPSKMGLYGFSMLVWGSIVSLQPMVPFELYA